LHDEHTQSLTNIFAPFQVPAAEFLVFTKQALLHPVFLVLGWLAATLWLFKSMGKLRSFFSATSTAPFGSFLAE
jgi:hypothetical protein